MKAIFALLLFIFSISKIGFTQWDGNNTTVNNPVSAPTSGIPVFSVSDQYGGAILVWNSGNQVLAQRKTVGGQLKWGNAANPVALFNGAGGTVELTDAISDNSSGVYISYTHRMNASTSNLYVQHIASNGIRSFSNNGLLINPKDSSYSGDAKLALANDGVFIVWGSEEFDDMMPHPQSSKLFLQKISTQGNFVFDSSGIAVSTSASYQFWPMICADGNGGVYIAFTDTRNSSIVNEMHDNFDMYAQRFDGNGNKLWNVNDVVISNEAFHQTTHIDYAPPAIRNEKTIFTSSDGGLYILYGSASDENYLDNYYLEIKKINSSGLSLWANAVRASDSRTAHHFLQVDDDNEAGLVLSWRRTGAMATIYAQRINNSGARLWGDYGTLVPPDYDFDFQMTGHSMIKDGDGNFVFTWRVDSVKSDMSDQARFIKAQKLDGNANKLWGTNAVFINKNDEALALYPNICKSLDGSTIISWTESRGIYAALVQADGSLKNIENISGYTAIASGNWNDPAIWLNGIVPPPGAEVTITQNITVNVNIICYSINIQAPAVLTVAPGATLTVLN